MTVDTIIRAVCSHYEIPRSKLVSKLRDSKVVGPRHVAMYLCREVAHASFPEIGRAFFKADHTTAFYAIRSISERLLTDAKLASDILQLRLRLSGTPVEATVPQIKLCPTCDRPYIHEEDRKDLARDIKSEMKRLGDKLELLEKAS